ncbi:MAG: low molecular weight protein arginine phosphatase [Clostridia bacterium]|nr:low molecular weight protein arginine phosphatase [Clostridia bacterium]
MLIFTMYMSVVNILFVCSGNTCRSPMATAIFKRAIKDGGYDGKIKCGSAGISASVGEDMAENAKLALKQLGITFKTHKSEQFSLKQLKKNKYVFTMTQDIKNAICSTCLGALNVYSLKEFIGGEDVPDPYGGSFEEYFDVAKYLKYVMGRLLDRIVLECRLK